MKYIVDFKLDSEESMLNHYNHIELQSVNRTISFPTSYNVSDLVSALWPEFH